jgi:hypothetical protein
MSLPVKYVGEIKGEVMRLIGCMLLLSGWLIVLAALDMLTDDRQRAAFILAGLLVEAIGLALLACGYTAVQRRSK